MVQKHNLATARGFKPMTAAKMEMFETPIASAAGDGRLELYKSTMKYDDDLGGEQHGFAGHKEPPL